MKKNSVAAVGLILSTILSALIIMFGWKMFKATVVIVNTPWLNKALGVIFITMAIATIVVNFIHLILMLMRK